MYLMARPSKTFLFNYLDKKLRKIDSEVGLDAGSSDFKIRKMFRTKKYYGLDLNLDSLKSGIKKYDNDHSVTAILADLTKLEKLPPHSVNLIVSTNTIYQFLPETRIVILNNLIGMLKKKGIFIFDLTINEDLPKINGILVDKFSSVKRIYYKNFLSRYYESIFEIQGFLGNHPAGPSKFYKLISLFLSIIENLTKFFPKLNRQAIFFCVGLKNENQENIFDISGLPKIDNNFYNALN